MSSCKTDAEPVRHRRQRLVPPLTLSVHVHRQSTIIHTSLCRLLTAEQMSVAHVAAVQAVCDSWTAQLRGRRYVPEQLWWVLEREFATVVGQRTPLRFAPASDV